MTDLACSTMQPALFNDLPAALPEGGALVPGFLTVEEERELIEIVAALALAPALYKGHVAKRRIASFGGHFDYDANRLLPSPPLPAALWPLRAKVAQRLRIDPARFVHVLVAEYTEGTQIGWHRDVPAFESIVGVSLLGDARMRLRRWPPRSRADRSAADRSAAGRSAPADVFSVELPRRGLYLLSGPARWAWQHSLAPASARRVSITLRTRRGDVLTAATATVPADSGAGPA